MRRTGLGRALCLGIAFFACTACSAAPKRVGARQISSAGQERSASPKPRVVFAGSSSIAAWKTLDRDFSGLSNSNLGVVGSTYHDLVAHFKEWIYPALVRRPPPTAVVIYSGDNDLATSRSQWDLQGDVLALFENIRAVSPDASLFLLTVKVSPQRLYLADEITRFNEWLGDFARQHSHVYRVDMTSELLDPNSQKPVREYFLKDGLHLNALGYGVWRRALCRGFDESRELGVDPGCK